MNGELLSILDSIEREKGIDREILIQAVEAALISAAKKIVSHDVKDIAATMDRNSGELTIVADGKTLSSRELGRIPAQTAKQVIIQKIREAERDVIFMEFQDKVGKIVTGTVHRFEKGAIIVDLGRTEGIVPKAERSPKEEYHQGDRIQAYVVDVNKTTRGPQIVMSRSHAGLVHGLFELEVPEIFDGTVEIRSAAREPGDRSKIAVWSKDDKVDCVGACVGMRGTRVKTIVRELHGEKIDIIRWSDEAKAFIEAALAPAKVSEVRLSPEVKSALVIVDDDQLSLAIGRRGQNVRLASKLTGWHLDIKSRSELAMAELPPITALPGVGKTTAERLTQAGFATVPHIAQATVEQLTQVKGVGEKTATSLLEAAKELIEKTKPDPLKERFKAASAQVTKELQRAELAEQPAEASNAPAAEETKETEKDTEKDAEKDAETEAEKDKEEG